MSGRARVVMAAPAKVNLYLGVGALRADGYHDVETVLHAIELSDTVTLTTGRGVSLVADAPLGIPSEENLAYRAALALAEAVGRSPDVHIVLEKRIPAGAGLGGASSDAAAVLAGLPSLWGAKVADDALLAVATDLGADVPFFLEGGTALYGGRGDVFERRVEMAALDIVVVNVAEPVSTARAYAVFDRLELPPPPGARRMLQACETGSAAAIAPVLFNNMTDAATTIVPRIADALEWCRRQTGVAGCAVSGSGSAVFAVCASPGAAHDVAAAATRAGYWACATRSSSVGVRRQVEGNGP